MRKLCCLFLAVMVIIGLAACSTKKETDVDNGSLTKALSPTVAPTVTEAASVTTAAEKKEENVLKIEIQSNAIAKNVIGDSSTRTIYIYLPPSYSSSTKSYPVVYFLHGYGDSSKTFINTYSSRLDQQFNTGAKEFILVALDGNNKTGGSFYVNSPVSGNWEDYVTNELVSYMDSTYRTIANCDSRGIAGYSMGGFGALNLSLRHPDIFNSALVFCPGVFAEDALDAVLTTWNGWTDVQQSYAQAFSPDIANTKDFGNIIKDSDIEAKNTVWKDWMNGFSNWDQKLEDYLALNKPLKSILLTYSLDDNFKWIPGGCENLVELLKENSVNYSSSKFDGGHIVPEDAVENYFVPFFGENLSY